MSNINYENKKDYTLALRNGGKSLRKKYVVFGAGSGGSRAIQALKQFPDIDVCFCLDNYPKTEYLEGIKIIKADLFLKRPDCIDYFYCIASVYRDDIKKQLTENKIPQNHIVSLISIFLENFDYVNQNIEFDSSCDVANGLETTIFDLSDGFCLGGVEQWSYNLAKELINNDKKVILLSNNSEYMPPLSFHESAVKADVKYFSDFNLESIQNLVCNIEKFIPCTIFVAHISDIMIACLLLKKKYPDKIKIVSVVHGGLDYLIEDNTLLVDLVDYIFCVSNDSYKKLLDSTKNSSKILFKETPVKISDITNRTYSTDKDKPIKIAYAARLEKLHKHSELLIPLIQCLEKEEINYILDIAGDGALYNTLREFIKDSNLLNKIHMLGLVEHAGMEDFWLQHDISINLSECEGCSLAMVESMSGGAIPVFTNVFSTRHFIKDGINGFVVEFNDIPKMVSCIRYLDNNRDRLTEMGTAAHNEIFKKCKIEDYIDYINKKIYLK